jgi:hypothetical protein
MIMPQVGDGPATASVRPGSNICGAQPNWGGFRGVPASLGTWESGELGNVENYVNAPMQER